ncbi:MAG: BamA/TamA family outer membrane protein [Bacteroidales bacterium]|nr:BamA/TamA family outer membrane protein [Bacteroidales bacterium]
MKKTLSALILLAGLSWLVSSCATLSKVELAEDEYILDSYKIEVSGDPFFNVSELSQYVRQKPARALFQRKAVILNKRSAALSRTAMGERLTKLGYYDSKVDTSITYKGKKAKVTYLVELGKQIPIDTVILRLPAAEEFRGDFMADSSKILVRQGDNLSEVVMEQEIDRSVEALRSKGYYSIDQSQYHFLADTNGRAGKAAVIYEIPSVIRKSYIGKVTVSYPEDLKFKKSVLRGMNLLHPGDLYNSEKVSNTYSRFSSLRVFQSVGVNLTPADSSTVDCNISLTKSKLQGFKTNLEVSTNSSGLLGISPRLSYYHKNIFGGGEWLSIGFSGNFQFMIDDPATRATEVGTSASLSLPRFLGLGYERFQGSNVPRTEFNLSFSRQDRPEYTRNLFSGSYGYTGIYHRKLSYQIYPLQINYVRLFDMTNTFRERLDKNPYMKYSYQDHSDIGVAGTFYYSSSPDPIPTTSYYTVRLQTDVSGNVISLFKGLLPTNAAGQGLLLGAPFSQYAKIELALARGYRFGLDDEQAVAVRLLAGIGQAYGNSTALPYEKQFYAGGASGMRGWQTRSLGPGAAALDKTFSIPSQTGDMKLEADIEYRFPIVWMLEGALFAEAGNIWDTHSGVDLGAIAADYGLGIRLNMNIILIRLDMGVRLRDPSAAVKWLDPLTAFKSGGVALHFGVGYPF